MYKSAEKEEIKQIVQWMNERPANKEYVRFLLTLSKDEIAMIMKYLNIERTRGGDVDAFDAFFMTLSDNERKVLLRFLTLLTESTVFE